MNKRPEIEISPELDAVRQKYSELKSKASCMNDCPEKDKLVSAMEVLAAVFGLEKVNPPKFNIGDEVIEENNKIPGGYQHYVITGIEFKPFIHQYIAHKIDTVINSNASGDNEWFYIWEDVLRKAPKYHYGDIVKIANKAFKKEYDISKMYTINGYIGSGYTILGIHPDIVFFQDDLELIQSFPRSYKAK